MKREEQIRKASHSGDNNVHAEPYPIPGVTDMFNGYFATCFELGAKWADQHPNWISVKDDLPKHDTNENGLVSFPMVLVCLYDGYRDTSYYDDIGEEWGDYDGEVEYWMPMPAEPRKESNNV